MSAKWRALQHRHRFTYSAVVFPPTFIDSLNQSLLSHDSPKFYTDLILLLSLNSIYSQINHAKKVAASYNELLTSSSEEDVNDSSLVLEATRFYLEVLFLENSVPLHRTLVSALAKARKFHSVIGVSFRVLCDEYCGLGDKGKRFCVSRMALSVMGMPKLGYLIDTVEACAVLVAWDVVFGLSSIVKETNECARPSPIVLEQCQEASSCLYYLLQRFPAKFKDLREDESNLMVMVMEVLISILKSAAFSRDCYVAAGVSFCAALHVCLSADELGLVIMEGIFNQTTCNFGSSGESKLKEAIGKIPYKGDACAEIRKFSNLSRLCLIRGILTAASRTILNTHFFVSNKKLVGCESNGNGHTSVKTILYDGILSELCNFSENPTDSHFNFHALTVMQICLQQIKTSMFANLTNPLEEYDPIPENMGSRILRIIWNNLEDPLSQTVKQVHLIFDLFLDIQSTLNWKGDSEGMKLFLQKIALHLLSMGPRCKGRYFPLSSITKRLGASTVLDMNPALLFETVQSYIEDDLCCAITSFLKCFLESLRDECWSSDGVEGGYSLYRGHCLPPFLNGLASGVSKLRANLNTYSLPLLLEVDVDVIFPILAFISLGEESRLEYPELCSINIELSVEQKVAIFVSMLKASRARALIEGDIELCSKSTFVSGEDEQKRRSTPCALFCLKGVEFRVPVEWLLLALTHADEFLRVDAAESLFLNPKTASLPSQLELTLLKEVVPLNMRSTSTGFQMKWISLFRKFFSRVRTALEKQFKQGGWQPLLRQENSEVSLECANEETVVSRAEDLFNFMRWLSSFLFFSCYPSAPYKRKIMATELIQIMINVWSIVPIQDECALTSSEHCLYPYSNSITSPESTLLLVASIVDSWDRLRESSFCILCHFPTPLPGISSEDMVQKVIAWAKQLVCSTRVRESDAGALTLRLLFRKYVLELGWIVKASGNVVCLPSQRRVANEGSVVNISTHPVIVYIKSHIDWLDLVVKEAERDLLAACKNSFVHGVLLSLRYIFEELDWNTDAVLSSTCEMRHVLERLLDLVTRITSLALWVVSADAWCLPEDMDEMDEDDFPMNVPKEVDESESSSENEDNNLTVVEDTKQSEQIIMVSCWLAMKEVSLLLGTIMRKVPLPSNSPSGGYDPDTAGTSMVDLKQLENIGDHFLEVLFKMKHRGAIDKTRAGFTALCNRLLCSNDARLCRLTESWMEQLMERTVAKGQTVDDLLRRSAGIPAAFIALFLSEPEGAPKKLLPRALRWLIDLAQTPLRETSDIIGAGSAPGEVLLRMSNEATEAQLLPKMNGSENLSKIRDEGVIPTVHAFNVLKAAFNDTNLATDTSGFSAEALIVSIRSFSSPYWEIRNSACQAYTALIRRMIGFLNVQKRESARRALTGLEFFHRHPSLHPFLFKELEEATKSLVGASRSNLSSVVHPSLCPILILLSRLKPSAVASETGDELDPFLLMDFIKRCSTQCNLRVRVLASRALTCLVSNEMLPCILINVASELRSVLLNDSNGAIYHVSSNSIHGILLQLRSLLDTNLRDLADISKKEQILGDLITVLSSSSWIASPKMCRCPILNASFLRVLDTMLTIARNYSISKHLDAIRSILLDISTECLDVEASYGLSHYDPTIAELREQAAASYFSCVFQASEEASIALQPPGVQKRLLVSSERKPGTITFTGLQERLIRSLSDSTYEVRLATLKWLFKFLKSAELEEGTPDEVMIIRNWTKTHLQVTVMKLLESEINHRCRYYILRILYTWNLLNFHKPRARNSSETVYVGVLNSDSVIQLWVRLKSVYEVTCHAKTRETVICCLAICVKEFGNILTGHVLNDLKTNCERNSTWSDKLGLLYEPVLFFVDLIRQHSSSCQPVNLRKAAAEAMVASGLLEQSELIGSCVVNRRIPCGNTNSSLAEQEFISIYSYQILQTWLTCIKLLEDEDDGLRQKLARDIQNCLSSKSSRNSSKAHGVPRQVEKVIELTFDHLSSVFGHWIEYFDYLAQWVLETGSYGVPKGDLVRRVFDKEIDNHHEERLLICQTCCSHLENLPILEKCLSDGLLNKDDIWRYLCNWRMKFCHQLMTFAKAHAGKQGAEWVGGLGNHKDAFLPLYVNLLSFYAFSNCILKLDTENDATLMSDVIELGNAINPFLTTPLICNLYSLVVRIHKRNLGSPATSVRDDFDPYFLLRQN